MPRSSCKIDQTYLIRIFSLIYLKGISVNEINKTLINKKKNHEQENTEVE